MNIIKLVCIEECVDEFSQKLCIADKIYHTYFLGTTGISIFYYSSEKYPDIYVGYFNSKYFITLAEWRNKQIEEIII